MRYQQELRDWLHAHRDEMVQDLADLVAIRSVQGEARPGMPFGEGPAKALTLMLEKCRSYGFSVEDVDHYAGSADLGDDPKLGILAHLDVVPEGEGWLHDPYQMTYDPETDKLIGRGTSDDKGPAVAALYAMRAVKELGIALPSGVRLILGTNEENGSEDLAYYTAHRTLPPMVFTPDGDYPVITLEKGMARLRLTASFTDGESAVVSLKAGDVINAVPALAEAELRGISLDAFLESRKKDYPGIAIWSRTEERDGEERLIIGVSGTNAHASTPETGRNALTCLLELLAALDLPGQQGETIRQMAARYPFGETDGTSCGIAAADEISGGLTLVCSVMEMDAAQMTAYNDIRFPVCCKGEAVVAAMQTTLAPIGCEAIMCDEPHHTDEQSPFVQTLLRVYEGVTGNKGECLAIGGGTYVHHIEGGVAFGATFPGTDVHMHGAEEFILTEHLLLDAEMMALAITELCGAEDTAS